MSEQKEKTVTLISEAKMRCFYIHPSHVVKIHRGCEKVMLLKDELVKILPGAIVTFTEEFAKHLMTYKTFRVYGLGV